MNWSRKEIEQAIVLGDSPLLRPAPEPGSLSAELGLEFPYDWPEARMSEALLIERVVKAVRFDDVLIIAKRCGLDAVKTAKERVYQGRSSAYLDRIIGYIEDAFGRDPFRQLNGSE